MIRRLFSTTAARSVIRARVEVAKAAPKETKAKRSKVDKADTKLEPKLVSEAVPTAPTLEAGLGSLDTIGAIAPEPAPRTPPNIVETLEAMETPDVTDWSTSFAGLGSAAFSDRAIDVLLAPVTESDVEITPDGLLYLPEIKYRRILNRAFGPGGWGIAPRTKTMVSDRKVTREYGLVCLGRLVSVSRGEQDFFNPEGVTTAMEGCKSNALMRCCKDLGIASELWDPAFIREFKKRACDQKYYEKKKRFVWKRKDRQWEYPYA